jgi:fucose permease
VSDPRERLYLVAWAAMFVFGTLMGLPGALLTLPEFVEGFRLTLADRGAVIVSLFVGLGAGSAVSGPIAELLGSRLTLIASTALLVVVLPLMTLASTLTGAAAALFTIGFAAAGVNTTTNVLISNAFPEARGRRLNTMSIAVGAGGLAMPAAAGVLAGRTSWFWLVWAAAVLAAIVTAASVRVGSQARVETARLTIGAATQPLRQPGFAPVVLLVALGAGTDVTMAGWTSTYLVDRGFAPAAAAAALSSYWFGLIAGRLAFSRFVDRAKAMAVARSGLACAAVALLLVLAPWTAVLAVTPFLMGVAVALLVPTSLALGGERAPARAGMAFGIMLTAAQVGGMLLPALVGVVGERAGLRAGMALLVLNSLLIVAVAVSARRPTPA